MSDLIATFADKVNAFAALAQDLAESIDPLTVGTQQAPLEDQLFIFNCLDYLKKACEALSEPAGAAKKTFGITAHQLMVQKDMAAVDLFGMRFRPKIKSAVSCKAADMPKFIEWAKTDPAGKGLVKETIHPKTLESWANEQLDLGQMLPPELSVYEMQTIEARKVQS